jgi:cytochrome P450
MSPVIITLFLFFLLLAWFLPWVFVIVVGIVGVVVIVGIKRIPKDAPPAPSGLLPWFGHMLSIGSRADVVYRGWWEKHGDIISVQLGDQLCVLVSSPALHKEIYGKHGRHLLERPPLLVRELTFGVLGGAGVLWSARDEWRAHRAFVANNMLSSTKVLGFVPSVFEEAKRCVLGMERAAASAQNDVDVVPRLFQLAMNALSVVALGRRLFDVDEGYGAETRRAVLTIFEVLGEPQLADYVRILRKFVSAPASFVKCRNALTEISNIVDAEFEKRAKMEASQKNPRCILDDVFDLDNGADNRLTSKEALRSIKELINAGGETTTAVMVWAMVAAAEEKAETQRAIDELDRVAGSSDWITPDHLANVPIFDAWLKETVRLWPLARVTIPRLTTEAIQVGDYTLPSNTMVLIHRQAIMMHPAFWRAPVKQFKLDRFLPGGEADDKATDLQWAFVMFGSGPRSCPGSVLAMWEVRLTLANILRRFTIDYSPSFPFDYTKDTETKLTTQPKGNKLVMRLTKRKPH